MDKEMCDILVCPSDKSRLVLQDNSLKCTKCGRVYPVRENVPVFV